MSKKLDYFTIIVVALCIVAIIFLLVKMMDLLSDNNNEDPIKDAVETVVDDESDTENGEEDVFDYDLSDSADSGPNEDEINESEEDEAGLSESETNNIDDEDFETSEETPTEATAEPAEINDDFNRGGGKYLVIAGTFKIKENGDKFANKLRRLSYDNAQSIIFDKGTYAVVVVDRFENMNSANQLKEKLEDDGYTAYVQVAKN